MSSRSRSTLFAALAAAAGLALLLFMVVGLGDEDDKGDDGELGEGFHALSADEFSTAVLDAQRKAGSWRYEEVETLDGQVKAKWVGEQQWDGEHTTLHYGAKGSDGEYVIEVLVVDGTIYLKDSGAEPGTVRARKPWLKLDGESSSQSKALVDSIIREADPARRAAVFEDPASFELLGVDNIGSAVAAHYRVTVPVEAVRDASDLPVPGDPGDQQVFDVYLDKDDQVVKIVIPTEIGTVESVETRTFSSFGDQFDIAAPPTDQVRSGEPVLTR